MIWQLTKRLHCCCGPVVPPPTYAVGKLYSGFGSTDAIDAYIESDGAFAHWEFRYLAANATYNFHEGMVGTDPYQLSLNDWDETPVWSLTDHSNTTYAVAMMSTGDVVMGDLSATDEIVRLDAADGSELWRYVPTHTAGACVHISIDEANDRVYLTYPGAAGICEAINLSDGSLLWTITTPIGNSYTPFASTPIGNDVVYTGHCHNLFATGIGQDLCKLDGDNGSVLATGRACTVAGIPETDYQVFGEFVTSDSSGNIFVATGQTTSSSYLEIACVDADFNFKWRCPVDGYSRLSGTTLSCLVPDGTGGVILAGRFTGSTNMICRIDASGSADWSRVFGYLASGGTPSYVSSIHPCGSGFWAVGRYHKPEFD